VRASQRVLTLEEFAAADGLAEADQPRVRIQAGGI
jgi:hypothetical protein